MTIVSDYTAILTTNDYAFARWNVVAGLGSPVIVTYSFADGDNVPTVKESQVDVTGTSAFTNAQRNNFKDALAVYEANAGVVFVEVKEGGMIDLSNARGSDYSGWADDATSGKDYVGTGRLVIDESGNYHKGSFAFEILLHEMGHAMGLQHSHEGSITLLDSLDKASNTVMTYTNNAPVSDLGVFDKQALQYLYGEAVDTSAWHLSYNENNQVLTVRADAKDNILLGVAGRNHLMGRDGNDLIYGRQYDDHLVGSRGADRIWGGYGDDMLAGHRGKDVLRAGSGDDNLKGGRGADTLHGQTGDDTLQGGEGRDHLLGGSGNDILSGGQGRDVLVGGKGMDVFVFSKGDGRNEIVDFVHDWDGIQLDSSLWRANLTAQQVADRFGHEYSDRVVLNFGDDKVVLTGFGPIWELADDLIIV